MKGYCPICGNEVDEVEYELYKEGQRQIKDKLIEKFRSDIRYWLNQKDRNKFEIDYILKDIDSKWERELKK